jgi:glycosidase
MEFHISRKSRDKYQFSDTLFSYDGNVIFSNTRSIREFTSLMNNRIDLSVFPEKAVHASQINAMGLIDEILHYIFQLYRTQINPNILNELYDKLESELTPESLTAVLTRFCDEFPPNEVYKDQIPIEIYLAGKTAERDNRHIVLEEILMLWLTNINPAYMHYSELFDDADLTHTSSYSALVNAARTFFKEQPFFGPEKADLLSLLHKPVEAAPYSLTGQLEYIRTNWASLLGSLLSRLLSALDFINEETKAIFAGPGPAQIPDYKTISQLVDLEYERFSQDKDWMPMLVLMAKNSYVWLDQLSKKYQRSITKLNEIPDEELDFLAQAGFTGLWLIGLWQRSKASEQIKRLSGNPEAVASAYSIQSYRIADDLGGEGAFQNLRDRAWHRGIRMASDMVPNHMGIDSDWVLQHPDYFLSLDYCPFTSYSFNGQNLSPDPGIGIQIEDHYFTRTDASVVFKRTDYSSGSEKYIYHGNDGTVMPWNDTAQLNYLNPEVREAIIQVILDVARRTPIIRFDAAMTLAKKHIQRLWFPEPGSGGAIPTRSDLGLSKADFDRLLPEEFWREVVDRVANEVPDTLLLAEAFWLMEGYFVRTLGMHRVYNSAFMHMLRNEDNTNFKTLIKNTLEFDPDILKRYVNFMNNPDEKTAVDQFGSSDKYFGVCTVLATLPGLPMFGHGQLEGFSEKYGMEYRRAYLDEKVDEALLNHHYKVIFPLLRKRERYSGAINFRLYDFYRSDGSVDEDVFAYSNKGWSEKSLVLYHNNFSDTQGWIKIASPTLVKKDGNNQMVVDTLSSVLELTNRSDHFLIFKELNSGLMFIRDSAKLNQEGLFFELHAYDYRIFGEFFEVHEEFGTHYREIHDHLAGRGVPEIYQEIRRLRVRPVLAALNNMMVPKILDDLQYLLIDFSQESLGVFIDSLQELINTLYYSLRDYDPHVLSLEDFQSDFKYTISKIGSIFNQYKLGYGSSKTVSGEIFNNAKSGLWNKESISALWLWIIANSLTKTSAPSGANSLVKLYNELFLDEFFNPISELHHTSDQLNNVLRLLMLQNPSLEILSETPGQYIRSILQNPSIHPALGINRSNGILWFNQELMEEWTNIQAFLLVYWINNETDWDDNKKLEETTRASEILEKIKPKIPESDFKVEKLISLLDDDYLL